MKLLHSSSKRIFIPGPSPIAQQQSCHSPAQTPRSYRREHCRFPDGGKKQSLHPQADYRGQECRNDRRNLQTVLNREQVSGPAGNCPGSPGDAGDPACHPVREYAKGLATKASDIDIYIETSDSQKKKQLEQRHSSLSVKIGVFDTRNLLIREIMKDHVIIRGVEVYFDKTRFFKETA